MTRPERRLSGDAAEFGVIALGGGAGSLLRYAVSRIIHPAANGFPTATLVINLIGSFVLAALIVAVTELWRAHPLLRPLLGTGLLGGFTTFSAFAVEARGLSAGVAAVYVAASVVGGVFAALLAMTLARRLPARASQPDGAQTDAIDPDLP